jgi:hypothetical protein
VPAEVGGQHAAPLFELEGELTDRVLVDSRAGWCWAERGW